MNANEQELTVSIDDSVVAIQSQFVAEEEAKEVQASLYSSKGNVLLRSCKQRFNHPLVRQGKHVDGSTQVVHGLCECIVIGLGDHCLVLPNHNFWDAVSQGQLVMEQIVCQLLARANLLLQLGHLGIESI
jgi:hypothetical protein